MNFFKTSTPTYFNRLFTISILSFAFLSKAYGQTSENEFKKEIGIRISSFNDFDFIYKKQKKVNKYSRIRLVSANLNISDFENFNTLFGLGMTYGKEKRKSLNEKFIFLRGWEFIGEISGLASNGNSQLNISPGFGYVLGFQYEINENFQINVETIPSISTNIFFSSNEISITNLNFGFNSNSIALSLMYRF